MFSCIHEAVHVKLKSPVRSPTELRYHNSRLEQEVLPLMPNLEFPPNLRITSIRRKPVKATAAMPTTTYTCTMRNRGYKSPGEVSKHTDSYTKPNAKPTTTKGIGHRLCLYHCSRKADFLKVCFIFNVLGSFNYALHKNRASSGVSRQETQINERETGTNHK